MLESDWPSFPPCRGDISALGRPPPFRTTAPSPWRASVVIMHPCRAMARPGHVSGELAPELTATKSASIDSVRAAGSRKTQPPYRLSSCPRLTCFLLFFCSLAFDQICFVLLSAYGFQKFLYAHLVATFTPSSFIMPISMSLQSRSKQTLFGCRSWGTSQSQCRI